MSLDITNQSDKLEKILKHIGVIQWDTVESEYISVYGCMSKTDLEKLIKKPVKSVEEFDEEDMYPFVLYIKDETLFIRYEEGEEGNNVHIELSNETLTPELKTLMNLLKEL